MDRLNPVTLVAGAACAFGAARARDLARRSQGGLILADADEAALASIADDLDAQNIAPERVSTLAFDDADPERWGQAAEFIAAQYGRLDWAVVSVGAKPAPSELVAFASDAVPAFDMPALAVSSLAPLMRKNLQGGAIVVAAHAAGGAFAKFVHAAAHMGAEGNVRLNGLALGGTHAPAWSWAPWLHDLVREAGSLEAALDHLARAPAPMARCASDQDLAGLIALLLSDDINLWGAVLAVDAGQML